jgi:antitoxin VapB
MGLNIKDDETVALVTELARQLGTTKTGAIRELARQRLAELDAQRDDDLQAKIAETTAWLEENIWPKTRNLRPLTREEEDVLLGHDEMFAL